MQVADFDYDLPVELVAQEPLARRDDSRLLVLERRTGCWYDGQFRDIGQWLRPGDVLVLNDTRVIPARVFGRSSLSGTRVELLLLRQVAPGQWQALARPARKARPGARLEVGRFFVEVLEQRPDGVRLVRVEPDEVDELLAEHGEVALPPYIRKKCAESERYQTVFARAAGAVAAPTAGLHFTPELLASLQHQGIEVAFVTLHAGLGTFRPVKTETVEAHIMHPEEFELNEEAASQVNRALAQGRRIVCCGTTTVRVLETQAVFDRSSLTWQVVPGRGETRLYICPGYEWKVCGAMLTNFHLPRSTLLMLVAAFAGRDLVLAAYRHAIDLKYRFYSFGDAMLIL
ncbi:MAG: tRNA preQ1(34) S-adenosylmethionine ribosyltransferase-isomerase QueA [candidate division WOR-3 bacterium]